MPVLGTLLVAIFSGLAEFFGKYLAKKVAAVTAAVTVAAALAVTLGVAISTLLVGLVGTFPTNTWVLTGFYLGVPSNGPACLSICIAVDAACAAYRLGTQHLKLAVGA